ncbi:MAG: metallophosphoesterase family protein [Betaproteobacteria bacterium]|nr:metallophosphoesterase family protein [Betaproteobacteria bacterium]
MKVGLISDTHGLLRPEAIESLRGSDYIVHAGDIGDPDILRALAEIAPVTAVRGNNDNGPWAATIRETEVLQVGDAVIYVIHDLAELDLDPAAAGFQVVVSGHSHQPRSESRDGVLFVNPGSAGPRRFSLPVSVGFLEVSGVTATSQLMELQLDASAKRTHPKWRAG